MRRVSIVTPVTIAVCLFLTPPAATQSNEGQAQSETIRPTRQTEAPVIDGVLDESAWRTDPISHPFITYNPTSGELLPQRTDVWVAYDEENIYFAFRCYDTEPDQIKTSTSWGGSDTDGDFGVGVKYGLTSSITADVTWNPDFSQVESDAFQAEVNRRYPVFYEEKRPFFMEGLDIFDFSVMGHGLIQTAVHTRNIVDPEWGSKITGTIGRTAIGVLAASDEFPGYAWEGEINPNENVQLRNWLGFGGHFFTGENIYYATDPSYLGRALSASFGVNIQPNSKLTQGFNIYHEIFHRQSTGAYIYEVNILNARTTYQFNRYFFIRGLVQYDSSRRRLLTDFLASFTYIPGTVLHLGYGSLYERRTWQNSTSTWLLGEGNLIEIHRGIFFKASYNLRF